MSETPEKVTVKIMQDYLDLDDGMDNDILSGFINTAGEMVQGDISYEIPLKFYEKYFRFNQAVKILVDFWYYNRGNLTGSSYPYPPSYRRMVNSMRWKIRRDWGELDENSRSSYESQS